MKKIIVPLLAAMLLAACSKTTNIDEIITNTNNNTAPDFSISFKNCKTGLGYLLGPSLNTPGLATAASWQIKSSMVRLEIGKPGIIQQQWFGNLWVVIDFPGAKTPEDITGTYDFPGANNKVEFTMYHVLNGDTLVRKTPDFGKLEINFDASTKTLNGKAIKFMYMQPSVNPFVGDQLDVKFKHVHFTN